MKAFDRAADAIPDQASAMVVPLGLRSGRDAHNRHSRGLAAEWPDERQVGEHEDADVGGGEQGRFDLRQQCKVRIGCRRRRFSQSVDLVVTLSNRHQGLRSSVPVIGIRSQGWSGRGPLESLLELRRDRNECWFRIRRCEELRSDREARVVEAGRNACGWLADEVPQ